MNVIVKKRIRNSPNTLHEYTEGEMHSKTLYSTHEKTLFKKSIIHTAVKYFFVVTLEK